MLNQNEESLQEKDLLYSFNQINFTMFDEFVLYSAKVSRLDFFVVIFLFAIIVRFLYFYSISRISYYFTRDNLFSLLSPLLFITGLAVFGSSTSTMDIELHPKMISLVFSLLFLAFYLDKKQLLASLFLGISLLFHPITPIPFLVFFYFDILLSLRRTPDRRLFKRNLILMVIPFVFLSILLVFISFNSSGGVFSFIDYFWKNIIKFRDPYVFLSSWRMFDFIHFFSAGVLFWVVSAELRDLLVGERKKYFYMLLAIPIVLSLIFLVATEFFNVFAGFQLYRSLILLKIVLPLLFSFYAYKKIRKGRPGYFMHFLLIWIVISMIVKEIILFIALPVFFLFWIKETISENDYRNKYINKLRCFLAFLNKKILAAIFSTFSFIFLTLLLHNYFGFDGLLFVAGISVILTFSLAKVKMAICFLNKMRYPMILACLLMLLIVITSLITMSIKPSISSGNSFLDMCNWITNNTDKQSVFLTEPFSASSPEIRLFCKRAVYYTYKDGAQVVFDRDYAIEWYRRYNIIESIKNTPEAVFALINKESANFIISEAPIESLKKKEVFKNSNYYIYSIKKYGEDTENAN